MSCKWCRENTHNKNCLQIKLLQLATDSWVDLYPKPFPLTKLLKQMDRELTNKPNKTNKQQKQLKISQTVKAETNRSYRHLNHLKKASQTVKMSKKRLIKREQPQQQLPITLPVSLPTIKFQPKIINVQQKKIRISTRHIFPDIQRNILII
jgi:hypothetical protein